MTGKEGARKPFVSALQNLNAERCLALLGDPGSGKSTFVNFVALCLAGEGIGDTATNLKALTCPLPFETDIASRDKQSEEITQSWDHGDIVPVRVILREFAARGLSAKGKGKASHLWKFIESELNEHNFGDFAGELHQMLLEKGGLLMLDGLDEVPQANDRRKQIKEAIVDFQAAYPNCRFLVTSRTYAYQKQNWQMDNFAIAILQPFTKTQINYFVDHWYKYIGLRRGWHSDKYNGDAQILKAAIQNNSNLAELAERPLLVTLMASLHVWRGGTLPDKREELYRESVDLLLNRWEQPKLVKDSQGRMRIEQPSLLEFLRIKDPEKLRRLLNRLAFEAHNSQIEPQGTADIPEKELTDGLIEISGNPEVKVVRLIEYLSLRAGILIPRGIKIYAFPHRTFQEYLAACYLTEEDYPEKLVELVQKDPNRWREVWLLAGAKIALGSTTNTWDLAQKLCNSNASKRASYKTCWGAHLAAEMVVESGNPESIPKSQIRFHQKLQKWLVNLIRREDLPAVERAVAGRNLAALVDPRKELTTLENMEFCFIPSGDFWQGKANDDKNAWEDEESANWNKSLINDYWMAKYPVSCSQFQLFVEADGYINKSYWKEAAELGAWKKGKYMGKVWLAQNKQYVNAPNWRNKPPSLSIPFFLPNHPQIAISLYECMAFCRWATEMGHSRGWLPNDFELRLPTEPEWEKSARGGKDIPANYKQSIMPLHKIKRRRKFELRPNLYAQRLYPWGNEIDMNVCNFAESGIKASNSLGSFPGGASPYGCEEMSGGIWESCSTHWRESYRVKSNDSLTGSTPRVVRGGTTFHDARFVRCSYRDYRHPQYVDDIRGFRLVLASLPKG